MSAKNTTFAAVFDKKLADNEILNRHLSYRTRLLQRTLAVLQDKVLKIQSENIAINLENKEKMITLSS